MPSSNRRTFLGTSIAVGLGSLTEFSSVQAQDTHSTSTPNESDDEDALDSWLASANDPQTHQIHDLRYEDPPTVYLGVSNTKSFSPPAIKVTPGTTVTWEWIGNNAEYNVAATDGTFDSGQPVSDAGETFEYTFESEGTYKYVSEPHADAGMKGVVVVDSAPSSGYPTVDEWLAGTNEYDGTITDQTNEDLIEITTGAKGNDGHFAFDPHALKVSAGTTVRWSWTGRGGAHNITFEDADLGSETIHAESGVHFEETFTETGVFRYACQPHRAIGQRGAIIVE
ncbi:halocyanin domain-containing protein [Halopenitus malekzadehii]|uniref:Halocyanin domain-containing protein n=1 Tax=Halopenitus malekzadehii TaxID=1267564 RepID=A0A1H6K6N8_9EURY|nr:halocyanin domain-containing protein [Halopenitus malekzadehii]SEH68095.1 halocyanin domain-containing protein [Halopenitus malekzadehii]